VKRIPNIHRSSRLEANANPANKPLSVRQEGGSWQLASTAGDGSFPRMFLLETVRPPGSGWNGWPASAREGEIGFIERPDHFGQSTIKIQQDLPVPWLDADIFRLLVNPHFLDH